MKSLITIIFAVACIIYGTNACGVNWQPFWSEDYYYDADSIVRLQQNVVRVWLKMERPDDIIRFPNYNLFLRYCYDKNRRDLIEPASATVFVMKKVLWLVEINCADNSWVQLDAKEFDKSGLSITGIFSSEPRQEQQYIVPDPNIHPEIAAIKNHLCR